MHACFGQQTLSVYKVSRFSPTEHVTFWHFSVMQFLTALPSISAKNQVELSCIIAQNAFFITSASTFFAIARLPSASNVMILIVASLAMSFGNADITSQNL
jgi:hypothetical protein